ncbi:OmpA-OmpF porin, OOP family [Pseudorhodobacter antarcticus]|uniref:OmpA-OmpF porin, OOP family n=1 Tax=Pseudorhodobacter antarcticus TaxID=1077947 RepID=A0A1H8F3U0_9RHOB|nr:OmpA family protein [Pseudorhodobacter antarcticus]SEN25797.1 OmpA-OmpF porin, OOP family [Pseudorhodobacter antarcticus]
MHLRKTVLTVAAVLLAGLLATLGAWWSALAIENRSAAAVKTKILTEGITWVSVEANGLQVRLIGVAPNEASRFRVVNMAGTVVQSSRVRDQLEVTAMRAIEAPRFSLEILRNDDGISLIGLVPGKEVDETLTTSIAAITQGAEISDMLESADYPAPDGWDDALTYGLAALRLLPRSKISVAADAVTITAISESVDQKRKLEADLARLAPSNLRVKLDISAPRPVLTPFTLRFVLDDAGPRFDACSADTERARTRILAAGVSAGITGKTSCTIGLGVPSPRWSEAAELGIKAIKTLGAGTITFSDADVTLLGATTTTQAEFDRVVGDLQAGLPPVFSLDATLPPKAATSVAGPAEFTAVLSDDGRVQLRGRLSDDVLRYAADSYSKSQFGADRVYTATLLDEDLPDGWSVRVLAGLESLALLHHGSLTVRADTVEVTGVTGKPDGRARISQILSDKLGQGKTFRISVTYDEQFDPLAALPTPQECAADMNAVMKREKITFAPGSAEVDGAASKIMGDLAAILGNCPPLELEIGGHTDSQGSDAGNRALSQARAEAVLTALQGRGLQVAGFNAKGYGADTPVADNGTEPGREANRRIEFKLLNVPADVAPSPVALADAALAGQQNAAPSAQTVDGETFVFAPTDEKWRRPRRKP